MSDLIAGFPKSAHKIHSQPVPVSPKNRTNYFEPDEAFVLEGISNENSD